MPPEDGSSTSVAGSLAAEAHTAKRSTPHAPTKPPEPSRPAPAGVRQHVHSAAALRASAVPATVAQRPSFSWPAAAQQQLAAQPPQLRPSQPAQPQRMFSNQPETAVYSGPVTPSPKRFTLRQLRQKYRSGMPLTMVTAYDYPSAVHVSSRCWPGVASVLQSSGLMCSSNVQRLDSVPDDLSFNIALQADHVGIDLLLAGESAAMALPLLRLRQHVISFL